MVWSSASLVLSGDVGWKGIGIGIGIGPKTPLAKTPKKANCGAERPKRPPTPQAKGRLAGTRGPL